MHDSPEPQRHAQRHATGNWQMRTLGCGYRRERQQACVTTTALTISLGRRPESFH